LKTVIEDEIGVRVREKNVGGVERIREVEIEAFVGEEIGAG